MARRRRRSLLVPEARSALDKLKGQVIHEETGQVQPAQDTTFSSGLKAIANKVGVPYQTQGGNGDLKAREAGKIGGDIGGSMVQKLIAIAEQELAKDASNTSRKS